MISPLFSTLPGFHPLGGYSRHRAHPGPPKTLLHSSPANTVHSIPQHSPLPPLIFFPPLSLFFCKNSHPAPVINKIGDRKQIQSPMHYSSPAPPLGWIYDS